MCEVLRRKNDSLPKNVTDPILTLSLSLQWPIKQSGDLNTTLHKCQQTTASFNCYHLVSGTAGLESVKQPAKGTVEEKCSLFILIRSLLINT